MPDPKPDPKSFADVLSEILGEKLRLTRFVVLVAVVCTLIFGLVYGIFNYGLSPETNVTKIKIGNFAEVEAVLSQPIKGGREYLVVVSPQGWQPTGIPVRKTDTMSFSAGGKVYIDLMGLNASLAARRDAEERVKKKHPNWRINGPEEFFTPKERSKISKSFVWGWAGPDGVLPSEWKEKATPGRQKRSVSPNDPYGRLLGGIGDRLRIPADTFPVGSGPTVQTAPRDGCLYLVVNDVLNGPNDKDLPENIYFVDNIGFFYVHVKVTSAEKNESEKKKNEDQAEPCTP